MSDGISEMWYTFGEYKKLCEKLGIKNLTIDNDWLDHYWELKSN